MEGDHVYSMRTNVGPNSPGPNLVVQQSNGIRYKPDGTPFEVAGYASYGEGVINIGPNQRAGTSAHEFMHTLGYGHERNSTHSIQSYDCVRGLTLQMIKNMADMYD